MFTRLVHNFSIACLIAGVAAAQTENARERARVPYQRGLEQMRAEAFDAAAESFQTAVKEDPTFELAYYMLGRAHLARKAFAPAVQALAQARSLYISEASRQFEDRQHAERYRRDRVTELEQLLQQLRSVPQTPQIQAQVRQVEDLKRQVQDRDRIVNADVRVPAFVSLSLGSAHFRSGNLAEAERAWLETVAADPRSGEAHNNLAVVYLQTGRFEEADRAVRSAENAGLRVPPALKEQIREKRGAGRGK